MRKIYTFRIERLCKRYKDMYKRYRNREITLQILLDLEDKMKEQGIQGYDIRLLVAEACIEDNIFNEESW